MESPEADERHRQKVCRQIDEIFSRIPLPENAMDAALAPTPEEERDDAAAEILKEAVRERYWRRVHQERSEAARVEKAMQRRFPPTEAVTSQPEAKNGEMPLDSTAALRQELQAMRARVEALEAQLRDRE